MSYVNPVTGKPIKQGAATWRRLTAQGYRVVADRLLRREHALVEERAIEVLGHPLNLSTSTSNDRLTALMTDLDAARNQPEAATNQPKPDPLTDDEMNAVFDDMYDIEHEGATVRWTSHTPRDYAVERIPEILDATRYYTFEVTGVLYTFPQSYEETPTPPLVALPADEVTAGRIHAITDLFEEEKDQAFALVPAQTSPQVSDEGEITFHSYDRLHLEQNIALPRAVVAALDRDRSYSLYGIFGHHDGHGGPVEFVDNNPAPQPLKDRYDRLVEQFPASLVKADALYGIDTQRWEKARGYLALIRWRLTPTPVAAGPPGPFHEGETLDGELVNCVLRVVREKLDLGADDNQGRGHKPAGKKLAAKRVAALARADTKMATEGFTLADAERLERECEIRLRCLDVAGNDLLQRPPATGRAARHLVINVTLHDNHGWASLPVDPPAVTAVIGYDTHTERALELAGKMLDAEKSERATTKAILDYVASSIPRGTRAWLCGAELVTHRGELYRSKNAALSLDNALEEFTGIHPRDFDNFLSSCAKGDKPMTAFHAIDEHGKATNSIGGASAYRFRKWLDREGIKPTPDKLRAIWEFSQVEAVTWHSPTDESKTLHHHIDMRAAYLACDRRGHRADSDAASEIQRYGFPTHVQRLASLEPVPLTADSAPLALTGAVQLIEWAFSPRCHPFTPWRVGDHLREHEGWITTPELRDLLESGDLTHAVGRQVIYSVGAQAGVQFPDFHAGQLTKAERDRAERNQAVTFVGKLARHADESSLVTHDANEAAYLAGAFGKAGRFLSHSGGAACLVRYKSERKRAQWFHVRAFVLAYTNIALRRMLRRFDPASVIRINTDAIFALSVPPVEVEARLSTDESTIKWGQWRRKAPGYVYYPMRDEPQPVGRLELGPSDAPPLVRDPRECPDVDASAVPEELTGNLLATTRRLLITGQGGCGKTYVLAKAMAGGDFAIVTPSNELAIDHANNLKCRTSTFHKLLALPVAKPIATWDPAALGHKLDRLPRTIIWDEAGMVPTEIFRRVLPYLESRGIQVIALLGEGQLNPFADKEGPAAYLREWAAREVEFDIDVRSQDDRIRSLKRRIWRASDNEQLRVWRDEMKATPFDAALAEWHPRDLVLCSTNALGATTAARLLEEHRRRFPNELAPIRFAPDDSVAHRYKNAKSLVDVPGGGGRQVCAVRGTIEWVPLDAVAVTGLSPEWQYAGWGTIHCVQGKTLSAPRRLYIVDHMLEGWLSNAVYTAVSRVRTYAQLRRVTPPQDSDGYTEPQGIQAEPSVSLIEARLRRHALDDRAAKKSPAPADRLDVDRVIEMIVKQDGRCACCDCPLLLQGFKPRHKQAFSIDRLNDALGHARDNVRVCCLSCNQRHKV